MNAQQQPQPLDLRTAVACQVCAALYATQREADLCRPNAI
jgi:hypothetical protein